MAKKIKYEKREDTDKGAKKILTKLIKNKLVLVNVGVGGGKTFMAIRAIGVYKPNAHLLVMTTKKHVDSKEWELSIDSYNQENKKANLTKTVINYESILHPKGQKYLTQELKKHKNKPIYLIIDEAHRIKNPSSKNFKNVEKLKKLNEVKGVIALSGTFISEDLTDTMGYLMLAGIYRNKSDFYKQHVTRFDEYYKPITKDRQGVIHNEWLTNYELIIKRFKMIQVHIQTKHLLPKTIKKDIHFNYPKDIKKEYNKIQKDYRNGLYESATQAIVAQRNFIGTHADQFLKQVTDIITHPNRKQAPVLIFYKFNIDLNTLIEYFEKEHPDYIIEQINGEKKLKTTEKPENDKTIILCQYKAASEAFNAEWSYCSIFYGATYSSTDYNQAIGRNVRNGQKGTVYQFRLIMDKTINSHYWLNLVDNKIKFTKDLMIRYLNETNEDNKLNKYRKKIKG